jgi:23S rRNA (uracil1939-C5)-methyltransferase
MGAINQPIFSSVVRDLSGRGTGVVDHPDGRVVFVPGVWPGDAGEFEIVAEEKRYALGRIVALRERSPHREDPQCPHHGFDEEGCWGCPWMMAGYSSQVAYKEKSLRVLLERSGLSAEVIKPLIPAPSPYGYRNRAQLKSDGERLGYVSPLHQKIVDVTECPILTEKNQVTLKELRKSLPNLSWRPPKGEKWVSLNINESVSASDVVPQRDLGFLQGNTAQNERMGAWLKDQLEKESTFTRALELFCGSGNFTEVIGEVVCKDTLAVESNPAAVEALRSKGLKGVRALALNLYGAKALPQVQKQMPQPEVLVLDPPRTGFKDLAKWVRTFKTLRSVYYISCDPVTFVRDAKTLVDRGVDLVEITPIDLFPHTPHTEVMAKFQIR